MTTPLAPNRPKRARLGTSAVCARATRARWAGLGLAALQLVSLDPSPAAGIQKTCLGIALVLSSGGVRGSGLRGHEHALSIGSLPGARIE